jgi:hypothetical protein
MKRMGAMMLASGLLLGSATGAAALERRNEGARFGVNRQMDAEKDAKREFRQRIQAKQREYRELRRTGDPRAEQVQQEIRAMKDEVKKQQGKKPHGRGR